MSIGNAQTTAPVNRTWLAAGLLVTVLAMVAGGVTACEAITDSGPGQSAQQGQTYQHKTSRVEIDLGAGDITLSPGSADQVVVDRRLRWKHTRPTTHEDWDGSTLRVSAVCPDQDNCSVNYTLQVPANVTVQAHTAAGNLSIRDVTGALDLRNESGNVKVYNPQAQVRIQGTSGDITGSGLRSTDVQVQTNSGDITLGFNTSPNAAKATTQSGTVRITVPRAGSGADGYHVQAATNAGQRQVQVQEDSAGQHSIVASADAGDVIVQYA
jgi:hypothetical protein